MPSFSLISKVQAALRLDYRLDECNWSGAINEVVDSSGNGFHGTIRGDVLKGAGALCLGGDLSENSPGDYIESKAGVFNGVGNFSISFWFKLPSSLTRATQTVFSADRDNSSNRNIEAQLSFIWPGGRFPRIRLRLKNRQWDVRLGHSVSDGNWHHIVWTRDEGLFQQNCLYLDGTRVQCRNWLQTGGRLKVRRFWIGQDLYRPPRPTTDFEGLIDEFKVFDHVVNARAVYQNEKNGKNYDGSPRLCRRCPPLVDYHMDECSWDGTSGEVKDSSGNGYNATSVGASIVDVPDVLCSHGDFTRDHYLTLPTPFHISSSWTAAFWAKFPLQSAGHIKLNLGGRYGRCYVYVIGSVSGTGDLAVIAENVSTGRLYWGVYNNTGSIRHFLPFPHLSGWHHLAFVASGTKTSLFIDGAYHSDVPHATSGNVVILMSSTDYTSRETLGAEADEFIMFNRAMSPAEISQLYSNQASGKNWDGTVRNCPVCGVSIDHYEIHHPGTGLTCTPVENIEIRACENANCTALYSSGSSTVTLFPTGWVGGDTRTFTGSTLLDFAHTTAETVSIGLTNSNPVADYCCVNSSIGGASYCTPGDYSQCEILFQDSGFLFEQVNATSCTDGHGVIRARRKSDPRDPDAKCVPTFSDTDKVLTLWATYDNPSTGTMTLSVNGTEVGPPSTLAANVTLHFDSNGDAPFSAHYADAGRLWLGVNGTGNYTFMTGGNYLLFTPATFTISTALNNSGLTGSPRLRAGRPFSLTIQAECANGTITQNYSDNATLWVEQSKPVGASSGTLYFKGKNYGVGGGGAVVSFENGVAQDANATYSDVGVLTLHVKDDDYFSNSIPTANATLGRFYPDHFTLISSSIGPGCGTFTYMNQPFSVSFTLRAENASNATTQNYDTGLLGGSITANVTLYGEDSSTGTDLTTRLNPTAIGGNWTSGHFTYSGNFTFSRLTSPDGPIALNLGLNTTDQDAIPIKNQDLDCASGTCRAKLLPDSPEDFLYGRLDIYNNYGPETDNLTLEVETLYWDGSGWSVSSGDTCTSLSKSTFSLGDWTDNLDPGETDIIDSSVTGISAGGGNITLSAPGSGNWGSVTVDLNATSPHSQWLSGGLNGTATFGIYRGNDRLIHWIELD